MFPNSTYRPQGSVRSYSLEAIWSGIERGLRLGLRRLVQRPEDDDLISDALLRVFTALHRSPPISDDSKLLASWVAVIARREAIDFVRQETRRRCISYEADAVGADGKPVVFEDFVDKNSEPVDRLIAKETCDRCSRKR